jgi:hypothetical protein
VPVPATVLLHVTIPVQRILVPVAVTVPVPIPVKLTLLPVAVSVSVPVSVPVPVPVLEMKALSPLALGKAVPILLEGLTLPFLLTTGTYVEPGKSRIHALNCPHRAETEEKRLSVSARDRVLI